MAKLVCSLNQSLDGYIDHQKLGPPGPAVYRHFLEHMRSLSGVVYGRGMYQVMRYCDDDQPAWEAMEREFAAAWRGQPKWVVSRSLTSVGPNATLVAGNVTEAIGTIKADLAGEVEVGGPELARSLAEAGLLDEYRVYLRPVVLGAGKPFFAGPPAPLRLLSSDIIAEDVVRLTYAPR